VLLMRAAREKNKTRESLAARGRIVRMLMSSNGLPDQQREKFRPVRDLCAS
jgi:hypothetical protein